MALENEDIEKIGMILALKLHEAMEPIRDTMQKHAYMLTGPEGDNGLCGDMKCVKKDLTTIQTDITKFKAYAVAISGAISTAFMVGREIVGSVFKH